MSTRPPLVTIITPCYNEQDTVIKFLQVLEQSLAPLPFCFTIVVVNDCSTDDTLILLKNHKVRPVNMSLEIINLKYNAGHQAAIYQGFLFARSQPCAHYIVMDADGEDAPSVIGELLAHKDKEIVNVVRGARHESFLFRCCYFIYKALFRAATGQQMNFGNFCLISRAVMERAVEQKFAHFAAFLSKQDCSRHYIVSGKNERLGGKSKMNFIKHTQHAARSFAEYGLLLMDLPQHSNHTGPIYDLCANDHSKEAV